MLPARITRLRCFGCSSWLAAAWGGVAAGASNVTRRLELSESTCTTTSETICFNSPINCAGLYSRCSMRRRRCSQMPVSSTLLSKSSLISPISSTPVGVAMSDLRCLRIYCRLKSVSIMAARVEGRPMPFCFNASRRLSSSTILPAVSIARSSVASV